MQGAGGSRGTLQGPAPAIVAAMQAAEQLAAAQQQQQGVAGVAGGAQAGPWGGGGGGALLSPCPPCAAPVPVVCVGGHGSSTFPCSVARPYSCGHACGRPLPCGNHSCGLACHMPPSTAGELGVPQVVLVLVP